MPQKPPERIGQHSVLWEGQSGQKGWCPWICCAVNVVFSGCTQAKWTWWWRSGCHRSRRSESGSILCFGKGNRARRDGALGAAAPSMLSSVGTRWSGGVGAGGWSGPNRPVKFSPGLRIGVPGWAGMPGEALAEPLESGCFRLGAAPDAHPGWSGPTSGVYALRLHLGLFVLVAMTDEWPWSPPL